MATAAGYGGTMTYESQLIIPTPWLTCMRGTEADFSWLRWPHDNIFLHESDWMGWRRRDVSGSD